MGSGGRAEAVPFPRPFAQNDSLETICSGRFFPKAIVSKTTLFQSDVFSKRFRRFRPLMK
jgi:hypothetical protein